MYKRFQINNVWTQEDAQFLAHMGISRENGSIEPVFIDEGQQYEQISSHFSDTEEHPLYREWWGYRYSIDEVLASEYCVLYHLAGKGYPEPSEDFAYEKIVYDMDKLCRCGQEHIQIGNYRIGKPPRRELWTYMAWVHDVVFVTERLYNSVFQPIGIGYREVNNKRGKLHEGVLQLDIPTLSEDLELSMFEYEICPDCGRKKYGAQFHVPFFPQGKGQMPPICLTKEYFGYGGMVYHMILISKELVEKLVGLRLIRYNDLIPCRRNYLEFLDTIEY